MRPGGSDVVFFLQNPAFRYFSRVLIVGERQARWGIILFYMFGGFGLKYIFKKVNQILKRFSAMLVSAKFPRVAPGSLTPQATSLLRRNPMLTHHATDSSSDVCQVCSGGSASFPRNSCSTTEVSGGGGWSGVKLTLLTPVGRGGCPWPKLRDQIYYLTLAQRTKLGDQVTKNARVLPSQRCGSYFNYSNLKISGFFCVHVLKPIQVCDLEIIRP